MSSFQQQLKELAWVSKSCSTKCIYLQTLGWVVALTLGEAKEWRAEGGGWVGLQLPSLSASQDKCLSSTRGMRNTIRFNYCFLSLFPFFSRQVCTMESAWDVATNSWAAEFIHGLRGGSWEQEERRHWRGSGGVGQMPYCDVSWVPCCAFWKSSFKN